MLHIQFLMLRHNMVVLPGVGAFIKEHRAAKYDSVANCWYPPKERISFVAGQYPEDNLLLKSIIRRESLPLSEARSILRKRISELLDKVNDKKEVIIDNFGALYLTTDGRISFLPSYTPEEGNMVLGYYPVKQNAEDEATAQDTTEQNMTSKFDTNRNYYIAINKQLLRAACSLIIFLIAAVSFIMPTPLSVDSSPVAETVIETVPAACMTFEKAAQPTDSTPSVATATAINLGKHHKYYLIVGTFRTEKEAKEYISTSQEKELESVPTKTLCRVSCASSDDEGELRAKLNSKEFKSAYSEGWIWESRD